ncbi:MAG TPA: hypothetical protein PLW57_06055 [Sphaerochaeta sp.]|nr:hypothetical protein [Sphaerochaeta sp.]
MVNPHCVPDTRPREAGSKKEVNHAMTVFFLKTIQIAINVQYNLQKGGEKREKACKKVTEWRKNRAKTWRIFYKAL